jgi:hypothetical protein
LIALVQTKQFVSNSWKPFVREWWRLSASDSCDKLSCPSPGRPWDFGQARQ